MRQRQIFGALLLTAGLAAQTATQPLQVTAIRFWSLADITRVAIETNGGFEFKSDRIPNPDRLFFDLHGARPHLGGKGITVKQVGDKLLKRVRIAENVPGVTRVVLDLEDNVEYTASQLASPDRLMIELRRGKPAGEQPALPVVTSVSEPPVAPPPPASLPVVPAKAVEVTPPVLAKMAPAEVPMANPAHGSNSLTRALGLKISRVVIDAGHGGHDQGTASPSGLLEKDVVLDVALRLGKLVEEKMGSEVVYTRSDDTFIPLEERTAIANRKKADLFISIHANSSPIAKVGGIETYYLNFTTATDALDVAARENASSGKTVYELQDLVQTIARHDTVEESRSLALEVQSSLQSFEIKNNPAAKDRGIRKAPFIVLIGAQMPSILAEIGFLSNTRDQSLLNKPEQRQKLAEALYKGIFKYSQSLSHYEVTRSSASASLPSHTEDSAK